MDLDALIEQYQEIKSTLFSENKSGAKVFEVGCGAGFYLYLFANDGFKVGGLDYSQNQLELLQKFIPQADLTECICAEANNLPTDVKCDAIFSWGVFYYFPNLIYAEQVLEKMLKKTAGVIYILDIYDKDLEEDCMAYRRKNIPNYDELYKDLPKLFYPRSFFEKFAQEKNLKISFRQNKLKNYHNAPYTYHCCLERF